MRFSITLIALVASILSVSSAAPVDARNDRQSEIGQKNHVCFANF